MAQEKYHNYCDQYGSWFFFFSTYQLRPSFSLLKKNWKYVSKVTFFYHIVCICCGTESILKQIKISWNTAHYNYGNIPLLSSNIVCASQYEMSLLESITYQHMDKKSVNMAKEKFHNHCDRYGSWFFFSFDVPTVPQFFFSEKKGLVFLYQIV